MGRGLNAGIAAMVRSASATETSTPSSRFRSMILSWRFTSSLRALSSFFHRSRFRSSRLIDSTSIRRNVRSRRRSSLATSGISRPASPWCAARASSATRSASR